MVTVHMTGLSTRYEAHLSNAAVNNASFSCRYDISQGQSGHTMGAATFGEQGVDKKRRH